MSDHDHASDGGVDPNDIARLLDLSGTVLGKYRLISKVGQGGMAQVYKAYQADLDRYVAVKILHPHLTGDQAFTARFRREARAIAALEHPNIIHVYDFDTIHGQAFLVTEYLSGLSLKALLYEMECRGEQMELQEIGRIMSALTDALDYAHRHGVIHRDIKPSNVLITSEGRPVLTDFGIAQMIDTTTLTENSGSLGTPAYMSPEQGKGERCDSRSDIYALGVLLYRLSTGHLPFDADTPYALILKHITAPLPLPRTIRPDLPEAVERVILKAMAKAPEHRYQTAGEMGAALRAALTPPPHPQRTSGHSFAEILHSTSWMKRYAPAVLAIGFGVGLLLLSQGLWRDAQSLPAPLTPNSETSSPLLTLNGPESVEDTWLDPDLPDAQWYEADLVHLQGPLTPDRLLLRFNMTELPQEASILSATLALRTQLWGEVSFPGAAVAYRVLTPWDPYTTTYKTPWSTPGLAAGVDYDPTPLDIVPVPDDGYLTFDIGPAVIAWHEEGKPNYGVVIMMSEDSHNQAHHWVYMSEQPNPADRPTLRIRYEVRP